MTGVSDYKDLDTWKLTEEFKDEVYRIVLGSPRASSDLRYRSQITDAAARPSANVAEGFKRFSPGDFARFIDYALGSVAETEHRLNDGIKLDYFSASTCARAFKLAGRSTGALIRLKQSQLRYLAEQKAKRKAQRQPGRQSRSS